MVSFLAGLKDSNFVNNNQTLTRFFEKKKDKLNKIACDADRGHLKENGSWACAMTTMNYECGNFAMCRKN